MPGLRRISSFVATILFHLILTACLAFAQLAPSPTADWELTTVFFGRNLGERMKLKIDKDELSGAVYRGENIALHGTLHGSDVNFEFKESDGTVDGYAGRLIGDAMSGEYSSTDPHGIKTIGRWSARRAPSRPAQPRLMTSFRANFRGNSPARSHLFSTSGLAILYIPPASMPVAPMSAQSRASSAETR